MPIKYIEYEVIRKAAKQIAEKPYQLVQGSKFENTSIDSSSKNAFTTEGWTFNASVSGFSFGSTNTRSDNFNDFNMNTNYNTGDLGYYSRSISLIDGHKYLMTWRTVRRNVSDDNWLSIYDTNGNELVKGQTMAEAGLAANAFGNPYTFFTYDESQGTASEVRFKFDTQRSTYSERFGVKAIMVVDLTATYGAGSEPVSLETFWADYSLNANSYCDYLPVPEE